VRFEGTRKKSFAPPLAKTCCAAHQRGGSQCARIQRVTRLGLWQSTELLPRSSCGRNYCNAMERRLEKRITGYHVVRCPMRIAGKHASKADPSGRKTRGFAKPVKMMRRIRRLLRNRALRLVGPSVNPASTLRLREAVIGPSRDGFQYSSKFQKPALGCFGRFNRDPTIAGAAGLLLSLCRPIRPHALRLLFTLSGRESSAHSLHG
jgi:hypothetical protein